MLATASLGAIFSSCAPEFGTRSVTDRWQQIEPKVLVAVDGYRYGDKAVDRRGEVAAIRAALPSRRARGRRSATSTRAADGWAELARTPTSRWRSSRCRSTTRSTCSTRSGTTGLPKPIVHGHGGILLEHLKMLALHHDLGPGDRFFWFTTTGWMMWNFLVSGPAVGAAIVLFDGNPGHPDLGALWRLAEEAGITYFGTSAPFLLACRKAGLVPARSRPVGAARARLDRRAAAAGGLRLGVRARRRRPCSSSRCPAAPTCAPASSAASPLLPVRAGEISCRCLGAQGGGVRPDRHAGRSASSASW